MKKIDFKNIFRKKIGVAVSGSSLSWPLYFMRDWKIMVCIFAVGLVVISFFAWKIYLSDQIGGGYLTPNEVTLDTSVRVIDLKKLQANLLILENKRDNFLKLRADQLKTVDPSL